MSDLLITSAQSKRLHTLWSMYARHSIGDFGRDARLRWICANIGRLIASSNELTRKETNTLIDLLQTSVGQATEPARRQRRGTAGRRGAVNDVLEIATAEDLARIQDAVQRLGWDQSRLDAFLRSKSSPLKNRSNPQIRTSADANKVWWALKKFLQREGKWEDRTA